ncbi:MAG: hypothetical protein SGJ07_03950 [Rhodospirillaceae bacterium]|nr:hypothetical protein [Rhodospirillaceae bacterium]
MTLLLLIAFLWGAAEASFFFIVPDLWISFVAMRRGTIAGLRAASLAAAGAVIGGVVLWHLTLADPVAIDSFLIALPGIDAAMRAEVSDAMAAGWFGAIVAGGVSGIPYKLFVAEAATRAIDPALFFVVSVFARLLRFLAVGWLAAFVSGRLPTHWRLPVWAAFWLALYAGYFALVGF